MPGEFPPGFATLSGDLVTISRFLNSPTYISRVLRTIAQQQFVGDALLQGRVDAQGGAVIYEQSESIFANRLTLEAIAPGGEFPSTSTAPGTALLSTVKKWGEDTPVTLEAIQRLKWNPVQKGLLKLRNTVVQWWDSVVMAAINASVTQTQGAAATWGGSSANILLDALTAKATITNLKQGYNPDTLLMTDSKAAIFLSDKVVQAALRREALTNPVYTGQMEDTFAGLRITTSPNAPANPLVLDSQLLGSISDERAFFTNSWYEDKRERWWLRAGRTSVPIIQEPGAACFITSS